MTIQPLGRKPPKGSTWTTIEDAVIDRALTEEMILAAVDLLECGYRTPGIEDVALEYLGQRPDTPVRPRFLSAVAELGLLPSLREAILSAIRRRICPLLIGDVDLAEIDRIFWLSNLYYDLIELDSRSRDVVELLDLVHSLDLFEYWKPDQRRQYIEQWRAFCWKQPK